MTGKTQLERENYSTVNVASIRPRRDDGENIGTLSGEGSPITLQLGPVVMTGKT